MFWRVRPIEIRIALVFPPWDDKEPGLYFVWADKLALGELRKYADTGAKRHRWMAFDIQRTFVGRYGSKKNAVKALLAVTGKVEHPFVIDFQGGLVGGRHFDFDTAFVLGSRDERVYFRLDCDSKTGSYSVNAVIVSATAGLDYELGHYGQFACYEEAVQAGTQVATDWCRKNGVWVDPKDIEAVRRACK